MSKKSISYTEQRKIWRARVEKMIALHADGLEPKEIARRYKISGTRVRFLLARERKSAIG